ncbi:MAG: sigma-54-dependent Fis family transcriptional regulator [Fidelibacterota bacterium]|nr:MAG: sigma-54-dependent Fis family transcriptional regulator [Candidatus Neomarinimicrobiota bacterium]
MPDKKDNASILVVDDAPDTLEVLQRNLSGRGYRVLTATSVDEAIRILEMETMDLVITDLKLPKVSGMDLVRYVRENLADTEVMMITGYPTVEGAVEAVKIGAEEFLAKPFTDDELFAAVQRSLDTLNLRRISKAQVVSQLDNLCGLIGESKTMLRIYDNISKAAATSATVLISGESGTGKELVARAIHYNSPRSTAPFIPINCAGIPEGLLESELFGHVKGAFTGALRTRTGFFQAAEGGTIFLDEVSETSPAMQAKLLRVLQDTEVCMVGAREAEKIDVRIMAATNTDLQNLVKKAVFREDLYFRLNVITIHVPPLRERGDDILHLIHHFASKYAQELQVPSPEFTSKAYRALKGYTWPGNVRELENLVQSVLVMTSGREIDVNDLPPHMRFSLPGSTSQGKTLAQVETEHIQMVLNSVDGNKTQAAEILGIDRKTLREKLKKVGDET